MQTFAKTRDRLLRKWETLLPDWKTSRTSIPDGLRADYLSFLKVSHRNDNICFTAQAQKKAEPFSAYSLI